MKRGYYVRHKVKWLTSQFSTEFYGPFRKRAGAGRAKDRLSRIDSNTGQYWNETSLTKSPPKNARIISWEVHCDAYPYNEEIKNWHL